MLPELDKYLLPLPPLLLLISFLTAFIILSLQFF